MSQFIWNVPSSVHLFALCLLLIFLGNNHSISAKSFHYPSENEFPSASSSIFGDRQDSIYVEPDQFSSINLNRWSRLFRRKVNREVYVPTEPTFQLRQAVIGFLPYKKRTIPLELQKALYAHGIVGRRR